MSHVRDLFDCVKSRRQTVANPEVMYRSMTTVHAANICMWLKRDMKFDPQKVEFIGDPEANRLRTRAQRERGSCNQPYNLKGICVMSESTTKSAGASAKEQTDQLVGVLKSDAPHKEKVDACRVLGRIGTTEAVPVLAALLGDEKLSHMARYGLEPIPDRAVDDALRDALGNSKAGRWSA